jgi:hypothetical protein
VGSLPSGQLGRGSELAEVIRQLVIGKSEPNAWVVVRMATAVRSASVESGTTGWKPKLPAHMPNRRTSLTHEAYRKEREGRMLLFRSPSRGGALAGPSRTTRHIPLEGSGHDGARLEPAPHEPAV